VPKWFKFILGILLLPFCAGAVHALCLILQETGRNDRMWVALLAGAGCWLVIYLLLPKPMWVYVFGHELTHVLWTWLFGGKVKNFKTSADGGHVIVTKSNFLIALAPYFFPLYALLVVTVYAVGNLVWNWQPYLVWFHLCLGAAYAFHLTLTWHILKSSQSDITDQGYVFSAVVIFLGNAAVLLLGVPLLTSSVSLATAFSWWAACTVQDAHWFVNALVASLPVKNNMPPTKP
jgi:hypothetical protein